MRSSLQPFCPVCVKAIHSRLRSFFQAMPALAAAQVLPCYRVLHRVEAQLAR